MSLTLQMHITDSCDQRCKHCYIYNGDEIVCHDQMDIKTSQRVIEDFINCCKTIDCTPFFVITGGDPLLHEDFWEILKFIQHRKIKFTILGNPFHLSEEVVSKLESMGCLNYQMSLDGLKETHDSIRKSGSFDATLASLALFKDSSIKTTIMTTVSKLNYKEIPELVDVVVAHQADSFNFARYCPPKNDYSCMLSPNEYKQFLDGMWHKYHEHLHSKTQLGFKDHLWTLYLYEKGFFNPNEIKNPENLILDGCHCGQTHLTLLPNGNVYACRRCESPIGNIHQNTFLDIISGQEIEKYRQFHHFIACSKCELKNFCRGCPSVTKSLTGNFYGKDPQCWKVL